MMIWQRVTCFLAVEIWIALLYHSPVALADTWICTEEEARSAEAVVATANSWDQVYQQFRRYAHCDDGAIAEGFSESISLLLAEQWSDIQQLGAILISHSAFQEFVIKHIDETVPSRRLECIVRNVRERCPQGLEDICHEIETEVIQTLSLAE